MGEIMIAIPRHSACALAGVLQSCLLFWKESTDCEAPDQSRGINLLAQAVDAFNGFVGNGQSKEEGEGEGGDII